MERVRFELGEEQGFEMSERLKQELLGISKTSLAQVNQFSAFYHGLMENKIVNPVVEQSAPRLDQMKNCDYHRTKLKSIAADLNRCIDENIALTQRNQVLQQKKKTLENKLEICQKKLQEQLDLQPLM
jgi:hypothetical protein